MYRSFSATMYPKSLFCVKSSPFLTPLQLKHRVCISGWWSRPNVSFRQLTLERASFSEFNHPKLSKYLPQVTRCFRSHDQMPQRSPCLYSFCSSFPIILRQFRCWWSHHHGWLVWISLPRSASLRAKRQLLAKAAWFFTISHYARRCNQALL